MRRVLVPLDGSRLAESILPDARRLAGTDGELILVRDASTGGPSGLGVVYGGKPVEKLEEYLEAQAELLRAEGVSVSVHALVINDIPMAIDEAARIFGADLIACATHGRGPLGRLVRGGVAWRAVVNSLVPVLLRHPEDTPTQEASAAAPRRIMVPLDGSEYAEKALPLAQQVALEWNAPIWLVRVVTELPSLPNITMTQRNYSEFVRAAELYLDQIAGALAGEIHTHVTTGGIGDGLVDVVEKFSITDIVMASHGRTGLSRVILGSVADELIQRLHCPILVIPALASGRLETHEKGAQPDESPAHA